jgi:phosphatidylserine/phosphatidylglycerophosphate/cardiolipin synthase-like enzyme
MDELLRLSDRDLLEVAHALRSGRLPAPFAAVAVRRVVPGEGAAALAASLDRMSGAGFVPDQIAGTLDLLRADRQRRPRIEDVVELVTTGPEVDGVANRDTGAVVRELFASATQSVLVAGYAVYQGQRVFQALADRMAEIPGLHVRLFLDVQRGHGETTSSAELMRRFAARFRQTQWPADRPVPSVYFDPRSLDQDQTRRASLHAKCVVIDGRDVFISSANFTEAAHHRNIELGVVFRSASAAASVRSFFDGLLRKQLLEQLI